MYFRSGMQNLKNKIIATQQAFEAMLSSAQTLNQLEEVRLHFLGKKGTILDLMNDFKALSVEDKRAIGPAVNDLKVFFESHLKDTQDSLTQKQAQAVIAKQQNFDVTAYKPHMQEGSIHPYSQCIEEIENIFMSMGYEVLDGPELETDFYNFTALNIPQDHPARDMYDTLWTDLPNHLMRTHTSSVQIHAMQSKKPPIAAIVPGRTYRHEAVDASHDYMFMQCEGILIDKNITLSHLFATLQTFVKKLFNKESIDIRIRPGFFPFVEPGVEIDMRCPFCKQGCSTCKKSTWIEVFPGGLIHPNVLRACGIDPNEYSGFAFGFGLSRLVMLRYGINDIRLLSSGKTSFLKQF